SRTSSPKGGCRWLPWSRTRDSASTRYGRPSGWREPERRGKLIARVSFVPAEYRPRFSGGHWQTLFAWARRRDLAGLPDAVARYFDTAADARVLAHCHWQPEPRTHPTIVLLHGLEGSSTVHYMRG